MHKQFKSQEDSAHDELKKSRRRFKRKRETILVRVQKKWRSPLKEAAHEKKKTIAKLHDEIYPTYFKQNL
jgi:hypothetical protein